MDYFRQNGKLFTAVRRMVDYNLSRLGSPRSRPHAAQEADIEIPLWKFGLTDYDTLRAEDLMRGRQVVWTGKHQRVRLDPELPFAIWRVG